MSQWHDHLLSELADYAPGGYALDSPIATEPTAMAAVALAAGGYHRAAAICCDWLCELQGRNGSIGVMAGQSAPPWPTSLAMFAWNNYDRATGSTTYATAINRATHWTLDAHGATAPRKPHCGHNTLLTGWPWVPGTHSWLEPTAFFVLALKAVGQGTHPRTREAVRMIVDRLLPDGGCNYGNTIVLDQQLLPHVQPTGIALWALADENVTDERIAKSLDYLQRQLTTNTATASLCYGLFGLAAHDRLPEHAGEWLKVAYYREQRRGASCYKLALLAHCSSTLRVESHESETRATVSAAPL